jgi:hypothetical protein
MGGSRPCGCCDVPITGKQVYTNNRFTPMDLLPWRGQ